MEKELAADPHRRSQTSDRIYRMHRIRAKKVAELTQGSTKSTMGEPLMASNKLAYSGHQELTTGSDAVASEPRVAGAFK